MPDATLVAIVDDNELMQHSLPSLVMRFGYTVPTARGAQYCAWSELTWEVQR